MQAAPMTEVGIRKPSRSPISNINRRTLLFARLGPYRVGGRRVGRVRNGTKSVISLCNLNSLGASTHQGAR